MDSKNKETNDTFKKNLGLLPAGLRSRILKVNQKALWEKVIINYSGEGKPICKYKNNNGQTFHITSIKPQEDAERWSKNPAINDAGALFIYGSGFGYPLFEILKQKQQNTIVAVFEQNIYLFTAMLYYFDLEPLYQTQKFTFFVGDIEDFSAGFQGMFNSEVFLYATNPFVAFTPAALRNFKREYSKIHSYIFRELALNIFHMGNDHYDTLLGFHNLIGNIKQVLENPYLSILKDKFKDVPAFIIANGPSLDKNITELKKINGRGLIISTESAIIPLMENKIKPDILSVLERTKDSYHYHFEGIKYPDDISLLSLALIDKNIFPSFPGPKIPIFRNSESINVWMNNIVGDRGSAVDAGANVSHLAFEIAAYLGANPIVLVGQDYAFGTDGVTHSKHAVYLTKKGKKALDSIKRKPIVYTENNEGTQISTTQLWLDFKQGLERKILTNRHIKVINATEGGAKINGTICENLNTTIETYCKTKPEHSVDVLIKEEKQKINNLERQEKLNNFIDELYKYINNYRQLCQIAVKGRIRSKRMLELVEKEDVYENAERLEQEYEENFRDLRKFMTDNLYFVFLQQAFVVGFHKMNQLGLINSPERIKKIFEIYDELFGHLNAVGQSVAVNFEMALDKLEPYLEQNHPNG